ncbi:hypothetical protein [Stutzerimonas kunmingensis]|uniref:hypothetical protein n=1 Tax=Stutzerimonas kunmingensis TaxID=1211807 RepID=UPI00242AADAB|nr:hypothetical protein [Stutzerimonas kunmingensis]
MATTITHRRTRIVTLDAHEDPATHCKPGDIAIKEEAGGWGLWFVDEDGNVDGYGEPYPSHKEATWSAKAAAEYASAQ